MVGVIRHSLFVRHNFISVNFLQLFLQVVSLGLNPARQLRTIAYPEEITVAVTPNAQISSEISFELEILLSQAVKEDIVLEAVY